jgi:hypothetical protein
MEIREIDLVRTDGSLVHASFILEDELDGDEESLRLSIEFEGTRESSTSEAGFFNALCSLRESLELVGLRPKCFGACENVYPSPMILSMGGGELAYRLMLGKQALKADLVNIFDCDDSVHPCSVEQQKEFYQRWIQSL